MAKSHNSKVLIIGSGPAGYTAAIYAARAGLKPTMIQGLEPGGQLMITTDVENYPGFADVIQGPWLMDQMKVQAENVGVELIHDLIVDVCIDSAPFVCIGDSGNKYCANTIIISTGAQARWLGLPSEEKYMGFGVSACATCDGFFFRDKEVVVVGGGNTAVEEALYLTNHASKVTLIHRRDTLRAEKILQERVRGNKKITIRWNRIVEEILGTDNPPSVTGLKLQDVKSGEIELIEASGIFVAIGHTPNTGIFNGKLKMDSEGYIKTDPDSAKTSIPGIFAAGDVQDKVFRQAVTAAGTGCMAALEAEKFLALESNMDAVAE